MLAVSITTKVRRSKKDLVYRKGLDSRSAIRIDCRQDIAGTLGRAGDPPTQGRMIGNLGLGQEHAEQILGLAKAHAHREGSHGELSLRVLVEQDAALGRALQLGDPPSQVLDLVVERGRSVGLRPEVKPLLDLASVLINGLAAALGLLRLLGDSTVPTRKNGGGIEDPSTQR